MIQLTVLSKDNKNSLFTVPRVRTFNPARVKIVGGQGNDTVIQYTGEKVRHTYIVAELPSQVSALVNGIADVKFGTTTQIVAANGTTQAAGTVITKFMARVTSATAGANDSVTLQKATVLNVSYTVVNATNVPVKVWPASGDKINQQAVDTSLTIQPGENASFTVEGIA